MIPPTSQSSGRLRWGIPDAVIAWLAGIGLSLFAIAPFVDANGKIPLRNQVPGTLTGIAVQSIGIIGALAIIARRKGRGSLASDFGLRVRLGDWPWIVVGAVLAGVAQAIVLPISEVGGIHETQQEVARALQRADGWEIVPFVVGTVVLAPVTEELLFRGVLLRGLARRMSGGAAVFVSALAFSLVHPLGDIDSGYAAPAFLLLGLVSGQRAMATGSVSQSIALHAGFNLVGTVVLLVA